MEHRWSPELGMKIGNVDVCETCGAMRCRPKNDAPQYIGKEAKWQSDVPPCKTANERPQAAASAR